MYIIGNTSNASMQNASPATFDAGGFAFTQNTTNLDISKFHDDIFEGLNVAFGAEYRLENYEPWREQDPQRDFWFRTVIRVTGH